MAFRPMSGGTPRRQVAIYRSDLLPASETFIQQQAQSLVSWSPVLVGRKLCQDGLKLDGLEVKLTNADFTFASKIAHRIRTLLNRPDPCLVKTLRNLPVHLVHVHFGTEATDIWPSVRRLGLPMLVTLHGYDINIHKDWWEAGKGGLHRRSYPRRLLRMAEHPGVHFVAVSKAIRDRAIEFGIPERKITVSYIGVDTERFKPGGPPLHQRTKRILFVGRMVEKKAPLLLIRAFAEVVEAVPDAQLVMIGDGPLLPAAKRLAVELGLPVEFLGARNSRIVIEHLHMTRVFCLPSVTAGNGDAEGLPISILEAQAVGVPVVTSARGAVEEAVNDGAGVVVAEYDQVNLTSSLIELLSASRRLHSVSEAARRKVTEEFSASTATRSLESIYNSIAIKGP